VFDASALQIVLAVLTGWLDRQERQAVAVVSHNWSDGRRQLSMARKSITDDLWAVLHSEGCPFLALSVHPRAANGSKRRHRAKVEDHWILRVMSRTSDVTHSSNVQHTAAKAG
jgi:hypothetical protein